MFWFVSRSLPLAGKTQQEAPGRPQLYLTSGQEALQAGLGGAEC